MLPSTEFPRRRLHERMDDPAIDHADHHQALIGLGRINRISNCVGTLWAKVRDELNRAGRPLRLLDVAAGGGDVLVGLAARARRAGLPLHVFGCDLSPVAVEHARANVRRAGVDATFFVFDVLGSKPLDRFDIVINTLFLHHLDPPDVLHALRTLATATGSLLLIDDLRRSRLGLLAARVIPRVLTRSPIVHQDAVLSVMAAFTRAEFEQMATQAGLFGAEIRSHFPWRMLLTWRRPT